MSQELSEREQQGLAILARLGWGTNEGVRELDEDLWRLIAETNFGAIWSRPGLSLRDREVVCITALVTLGAHGVALHFKNAHHLGITDAELKEIILQTIPYAGLPKALGAMALLRRVQRGESPEL